MRNSKFEHLRDKLKEEAEKDGFIRSFNLARMEVPRDTGLGQPREGAHSPKIQLAHAIASDKEEKGTDAAVQISVVKIGGNFDIGPYIPVS
jgi:hypothetical protein